MKKLLSTLVVMFSCFLTYGQEPSLYAQFDKIVGQNNTQLSYGIIYKEKYRKKFRDNHNFFTEDSFKKGSIFYRGELFTDVQLKYELVDDFLVVKLNNQDQQISVVPEKTLVKYFTINTKKFIYSKSYGFLEELLVREDFSVLKKHLKTVKENRDADYRYHTFKKKNKNVLLYKNTFYDIDSKRDFYTIFPKSKKQIASFYKSNTFLLKNDFPTFVAKLITSLSQEK
ncbi:hypothetical protein ACOSP6_00935 [Tenacibaculum sp. MEBiC06402]|uniref:hypothetical protein n=1 Tax=unclassified Tenacibaculum TaxID=2635139 RepID=UPI003B9B2F51